MARNIQSQSDPSRATIQAFLRMLANAIFWLAAAIVIPVRAIAEAFPELAAYSQWAPILFYAIAFWSFIRAVRILPRLAADRTPALLRGGMAAPMQTERPGQARKAKTGLPVTHAPTVQRMR